MLEINVIYTQEEQGAETALYFMDMSGLGFTTMGLLLPIHVGDDDDNLIWFNSFYLALSLTYTGGQLNLVVWYLQHLNCIQFISLVDVLRGPPCRIQGDLSANREYYALYHILVNV